MEPCDEGVGDRGRFGVGERGGGERGGLGESMLSSESVSASQSKVPDCFIGLEGVTTFGVAAGGGPEAEGGGVSGTMAGGMKEEASWEW